MQTEKIFQIKDETHNAQNLLENKLSFIPVFFCYVYPFPAPSASLHSPS